MELLFSPPIAFLLYLGVLALLIFGRNGNPSSDTSEGSESYASGEAPPRHAVAAGYRAFSQFALYFAVFHLAVLLLATGRGQTMTAVFVLFLMLMLRVILL